MRHDEASQCQLLHQYLTKTYVESHLHKRTQLSFTMWIAPESDKQPPKHTHLKMLRKKFTMYPPNLTTCYEPHVKDSQRRHQEIEEVVATETKIDAHSVFIKFEIQK